MVKEEKQTAERMPTERGALKALVVEFMDRFDRVENEIDTLKEDQKTLIEDYSDRLDMKTLKQAIRTVKIKKKVSRLDAYESFLDILDEREGI